MPNWMYAQHPYIYNIKCGTKLTEYSQKLPGGTQRIQAQVTASTKSWVYFTTAATEKFLIKSGQVYKEENLTLDTYRELFVQVATPCTMSVVCWI